MSSIASFSVSVMWRAESKALLKSCSAYTVWHISHHITWRTRKQASRASISEK